MKIYVLNKVSYDYYRWDDSQAISEDLDLIMKIAKAKAKEKENEEYQPLLLDPELRKHYDDDEAVFMEIQIWEDGKFIDCVNDTR